MGSSAKRKKEKAKDFAKPKLKVGKTKPKATNATDTSFRAKSIQLTQQSLSTTAPTVASQFDHSLSLLTSKSDSQRRDALSSLTNIIHSTSQSSITIPQPAINIITKTRPLLIDASKNIRTGALTLLQNLPVQEVCENIEAILIYLHIGMTHMVAEIRLSSLDVLEWLLTLSPKEETKKTNQEEGHAFVSCKAGWTGTLLRLVSSLGWQTATPSLVEAQKGWVTTTNLGKSNSASTLSKSSATESKSRARQINLLAKLLEIGLDAPSNEEMQQQETMTMIRDFPLWNCAAYVTMGNHQNCSKSHNQTHRSVSADPYGYLNLFFAEDETSDIQTGDINSRKEKDLKDIENKTCADWESRRAVFVDYFQPGIGKGMSDAKKEGGEIGRAARAVEKALKDVIAVDTDDLDEMMHDA